MRWTSEIEIQLQAAIARRQEVLADRARGLADRLAGSQATVREVRELARLAHEARLAVDVVNRARVLVGRGRVGGDAGRELVRALEGMRWEADRIADAMGLFMDPEGVAWIHLRLCRELLNCLVAHLEFTLAGRQRGSRRPGGP